jgi:RND family efflux transporter MFP subunit
MNLHRFSIAFLLPPAALLAQAPVEVARVISKAVERKVQLPGEFLPYLAVPLHAKVTGFVEKVLVDRGSSVKDGQLLMTLEAPEMAARIVEAESKAQAVELQRAEAEAKLAAAQSTYDRLKAASATPGVVAVNDVVVAEKNVEAARALVRAYEGSIKAARSSVQALKDLQSYLKITAPFDGIITERNVHPGALVGPGGGSTPLLKLEQNARLRLTVAVPEAIVGGIVKSARVPFSVPACPGETFYGVVSRIAHSIDQKTRTMAVELDVKNPAGKLAPGMYPELQWPVRNPRASLLVPPTSIVTTTERTFVIRVKDSVVEWVPITRGASAGELVEVHGSLREGDLIVKRGSDELREGTRVEVRTPKG